MLGKVGTSANKMVYPEGNFLQWGLFIPSFITIDKQSNICRRYLLLEGLCVPSVKTTAYVCKRFITSFCARDHKTNQAISNLSRKFWNKSTLIWVGFLGVCFYKSTLLQTFSFQVARLQVYVAITSDTLLHQATRDEGKNILREHMDILVLIVILNNFSVMYYLNFNLWSASSLQVILYQFKKVKVLWGPGTKEHWHGVECEVWGLGDV